MIVKYLQYLCCGFLAVLSAYLFKNNYPGTHQVIYFIVLVLCWYLFYSISNRAILIWQGPVKSNENIALLEGDGNADILDDLVFSKNQFLSPSQTILKLTGDQIVSKEDGPSSCPAGISTIAV